MKNILVVGIDLLLLTLGTIFFMCLNVDNNSIVTVKMAMYMGFVAGAISVLVIKNLFSTAIKVWQKKRA